MSGLRQEPDPRAAGRKRPAARGFALLAVAVLAGCGGSVSVPAGVVEGTVTVEAGSVSVASWAPVGGGWPVAGPARRSRVLPEPDRFVVGLRQGGAGGPALRSATGARLVRVSPGRTFAVFRVEPGETPDGVAARLRSLPGVAWVARDAYVRRHAEPTDPLYPHQWHYRAIRLPDAWSVTSGSPVIVAVVDTGARPDHLDLRGVFVTGYDFVDGDTDPTDPGCAADPADWSHGTHVAGTVAALTGNAEGVAGVAWGGASAVRIMPLRVLGEHGGECGVGYVSDVAAAIEFAAENGARVVNLSLGTPSDHPALQSAVQGAAARGVILVASAGNEPESGVEYPARYPEVIAVAATDCRGQRAPYSARGPEVTVAAPGGGAGQPCNGTLDYVLSTSHNRVSGNGYVWMAGTSMAAPHVSGVAALLFGRGFVTPRAVQDRLIATAFDVPPAGRDDDTGWGLVDAAAAVGAQRAASRMAAFACAVSGAEVRALSPAAGVEPSGAFSVRSVPAGDVTVCVWQDLNSSDQLDRGDLWGRSGSVTVRAGDVTSGVSVTARLYSGPPTALSGLSGR